MNDWSTREAPTLAEFEEIAEHAYKRLPAHFRALTGDLLVRIEDFPTDEVLASLGLKSEFDLLGLYSGVDLARKSVMDVSAMPDMVTPGCAHVDPGSGAQHRQRRPLRTGHGRRAPGP